MTETTKAKKTSLSLWEKMICVQREIPTIAKTARANYGKYANFDSILEIVRPILNKYELFLMQKATSNELGVSVETIIIDSTGAQASSGVLTIPLAGTKGSVAQVAGGIITYAKRYSLSAFLGISTGDETVVENSSVTRGEGYIDPSLKLQAIEAAKVNVANYQAFFKSLSNADRLALVSSGLHDQLKAGKEL